MKSAVIILSLVTLLGIGTIASFKGLDLRRWSSWVYGAVSFVCGLLAGLSLSSNLLESTKMGVLFVFMTLLTGAAMRWHKQRYEGMAKSLFLRYGKEDDPSLFAKLVRRLLGKYQR